jgi:tetrahydromethanopterin S-methyltransferase subunit G
MLIMNLYIIILACVLTLIFRESTPYVIRWFKRVKSTKKRKSNVDILDILQYERLTKRVDELEEQLNNVAKNHYTREVNRKNNVRKVVREYLSELKND